MRKLLPHYCLLVFMLSCSKREAQPSPNSIPNFGEIISITLTINKTEWLLQEDTDFKITAIGKTQDGKSQDISTLVQVMVNDQSSNLNFVPTEPKSYNIYVKYGTIKSNTTTVTAKNIDNVSKISLSLVERMAGGTTNLIADGKSVVYIEAKVYDKNGAELPYRKGLKFYANNTEIPNLFFSTTKEGNYAITAKGYGIESNLVNAIARKEETLTIIRIPLVFHIMQNQDAWTAEVVNKFLKDINEVYANTKMVNERFDDPQAVVKRDPNAVNTYIEFYLAETDPTGKPLAIKGLDKSKIQDKTYNFYDAKSLSEMKNEAYLVSWNPNKYFNIWAFKFDGPAFAQYPTLPTDKKLDGLGISSTNIYSEKTSNGAYISDVFASYSWLTYAHEIGHAFGLAHAFNDSGKCLTDEDYCTDTPSFIKETSNNVLNYHKTCNGNTFLGTNNMDYGGYQYNFTYDQRKRMRHVLDWGYNLPTPINQNRKSGGRISQDDSDVSYFGRGKIVACEHLKQY